MIVKMDMAHEEIVKQVLDLQLVSYIVEAELIGFYDIPPLSDTIASLQETNEYFLGYYREDRLVGVASYEIHDACLEICRMMVHPSCFRQGIASQLLSYVEQEAMDVKELQVATGTKNTPARQLYERHGFVPMEEIPVAEGVTITKFRKQLG